MTEFQTGIDFISKLGPLGLIVVFIYLVGSGKLVLKREFDRERERAEKAEAALDATMPVLRHAIEAFTRVPEVTKSAVETTAEIVKARR